MDQDTSKQGRDQRHDDAGPRFIRFVARVLLACATLLLVMVFLIIVWPYVWSLLNLFAAALQRMLGNWGRVW